jgi:hypothetical protein
MICDKKRSRQPSAFTKYSARYLPFFDAYRVFGIVGEGRRAFQMARKRGIPGLSFSWRRAFGVSQAQAKLSRQIGIPLSRSGRQRKAGAAMGCCVLLAAPIALVSVLGVSRLLS